MADTIRETIIVALQAKLGEIRTANGYNSECGQRVERAAFYFRANELPAISIFPMPETATQEYGANVCTMPVQVRALFEHGASSPSEVGEQVLGDLIECAAGLERLLTFQSGGIEPQAGDILTGSIGGATAVVLGLTLTDGSWLAGDAEGTIRVRGQDGTFQAENLLIDGETAAAILGDSIEYPAKWTATGSAKDNIWYRGGGIEDYPQADDHATLVVVNFEVVYRTKATTPYERPA